MKKKRSRNEIYISPDGGETVQDEDEMVNEYAVKMRRKYPALGKAWKHYKTVWHLVMGEQ